MQLRHVIYETLDFLQEILERKILKLLNQHSDMSVLILIIKALFEELYSPVLKVMLAH